jgi:hypothetical protein
LIQSESQIPQTQSGSYPPPVLGNLKL